MDDYDNDEPVKVIIRIRPEELDDRSSAEGPASPLTKVAGVKGHLTSQYDKSSAADMRPGRFITQLNDQTIRLNPPFSNQSDTGVPRKAVPAIDDKEFAFDKVFPESSKQEEIYSSVSSLVNATVRGYNATIFAYGCTGSGKSYTMTGTQFAPGIIPRVISDIFTSIEEKAKIESDIIFYIRISYVELYQNNFRNLLEFKKSSSKSGTGSSSFGGPSKDSRDDESVASSIDDDSLQDTLKGTSVASSRSLKIEVRENTTAGVFLAGPNLRIPVTSAKEAFQLIAKGNKVRAIGSTQCNEISSRSHVILTIHVESKLPGGSGSTPKNGNNLNSSFFASESLQDENFDAVMRSSIDTENTNNTNRTTDRDFGPEWRLGKIHLVDLAGSERLSMSGAEGDTLLETQKINLALSALGDVLHALSKNASLQVQQDRGGGYMMKSVNGVQVRSQKPLVPVPYRNSKLTHLLKDSLGGNSKTVMITTVRNNSDYYQQTLVSLSYSQRAKMVKNKSLINKNIGGDSGINAVAGEIDRLKQRLEDRTAEFDRLRDLQMHETNENLTLKARFEELQRANLMEKKELEAQLSNVIHSQAGQLASQKQKIMSLQSRLQDELSNAQNRIAEQDKEINWLKRELDESTKSAQKPQEQLQRMQKLLDSWQSQVESTQVELTNAVKSNANLRARVTSLTNDCATADLARKDLQDELNSRNAEVSDLSLVMTQKERYCESLESECEKAKRSLKTVETENQELQWKFKSLESAYFTLQTNATENESKIKEITRRSKDIEKEKDDLKDKLTNMISVLEKKSSSVIGEASFKIQDIETKLRLATLDLQQSAVSVDKYKAELRESSVSISELNAQLEVEKQSNLSLHTYNNKLIDLLRAKENEVFLLSTAQSEKEAQVREELTETCIQEMSLLKAEFALKEERFKQEWLERDIKVREEMQEFKNISSEVETLKSKYEASLKAAASDKEKALHDAGVKAENVLTSRVNELKDIFSTTYKKLQEDFESKISDAVKAEKFMAMKKTETKVADITMKMQKEHQNAQASLESAFKLEITGLKSVHASELVTSIELAKSEEASRIASEIQKLNSIWEGKVNQIIAESNEKIVNLEAMVLQTKDQGQIDMKSALETLKLKFEAKYKQRLDLLKSTEVEVEAKYKQMIQETEEKLRSELEGALKMQKTKLAQHHASEIESMKISHDSDMKLVVWDLKSKYEADLQRKENELQSLRLNNESNIREVDSNWRIHLQSAKQMVENEMSAQFEVRVQAFERKLENEIKDKKAVEERIADLLERQRQEKLMSSRQTAEELETLESKLLNELKSQKKSLEAAYEEKIAERDAEITRLNVEFTDLKVVMAHRQSLETKAQKEQREEYDKLLTTTLADREDRNKQVVQAMIDQHQSECDRFKTTLDAVKERYEVDIESLNKYAETQRCTISAFSAQLDDARASVREEMQQKIVELTNLHKKELQIMKLDKDTFETRLQELVSESKAECHELNLAMSKLRSQLESEKYQIAEDGKLELSVAEGKYRASISMLEMKQQDELESVHASYKLKMKSKQSELEAEYERLEALHKSNMTTSLAGLRDEERQVLQKRDDEHRNEISNLMATNDKAMNALKLSHASDLRKKVDELELAHTSKKFELMEEHKRSVQGFEIEIKNLQAINHDLAKKLSDSKLEENHLSESRESLESHVARLNREIEGLRDTHRLEVQTVHERLQNDFSSARESLLQENLNKLELFRQQHELEQTSLRRELAEQHGRRESALAEEMRLQNVRHDAAISALQAKAAHDAENQRHEAKSRFEEKIVAERGRLENEKIAALELLRVQLSRDHERMLKEKVREFDDEIAKARKVQADYRSEVDSLVKDGGHSRQIIENLNSKVTDLKIELAHTKKVHASDLEFLKLESSEAIESLKAKDSKLLEDKYQDFLAKEDELIKIREGLEKDLMTKEGEVNHLRDQVECLVDESRSNKSQIERLADEARGSKARCDVLEQEKLRLQESQKAMELDHINFIESAKRLEVAAKESMRQEVAAHAQSITNKCDQKLFEYEAKYNELASLERSTAAKFEALTVKMEDREVEFNDEMRKALSEQQQSMQNGYFSLLQGQVDSILSAVKIQNQNLPQVEEMQHKFLVMLEDLPDVWHEKHGIKKEALTNLKSSSQDNFDESKSSTGGVKKMRTPIYLLAGSQVDKDRDRERDQANQLAAQAKLQAFSKINSSINNQNSSVNKNTTTIFGQSMPSVSNSQSSHASTAHWQAAPLSPDKDMCPHSDQLISAILDGDVQGVRAVIRSKGDNLNSEYWKDLSKSLLPLHRAISGLHFHGNERLLIATIECLCQFGSDINAVDQSGNTVLHKAIQICTSKSVTSVVRCLVQRGVDTMKRNKDSELALHSECKRVRVASVEVIELLLNAKCDPNALIGGTSALTIVLFRGASASVASAGTSASIGLKVDESSSSNNNDDSTNTNNNGHDSDEKARVSGRRVWVKTADVLLHAHAKWDKAWRSESGLSQLHLLVAAFPPYKDDASIYISLLSSAIEHGLSPMVEDSKGRNSIFLLCIQMASTPLDAFPNPAKVLRLLLDSCPGGGITNGSSDRSGHTIFDINETVDQSCLSSCRHLLVSSPVRGVNNNSNSSSNNTYSSNNINHSSNNNSNNSNNSRSIQSDKSSLLKGFPTFSSSSVIDYKERGASLSASTSSNIRSGGSGASDSHMFGSNRGKSGSQSVLENSSSGGGGGGSNSSSAADSSVKKGSKKLFL